MKSKIISFALVIASSFVSVVRAQDALSSWNDTGAKKAILDFVERVTKQGSPTAQTYLMAIKDNDGKNFDGGKTYRLTVPANAPVKQYWSATVYDRATHPLVRDMSRASRASNSSEVQKNADGSVDIYFGPTAPAGKESNWVPTKPGGQFEVLFRLYGPEKPLFEKTWKLPDVEEVK